MRMAGKSPSWIQRRTDDALTARCSATSTGVKVAELPSSEVVIGTTTITLRAERAIHVRRAGRVHGSARPWLHSDATSPAPGKRLASGAGFARPQRHPAQEPT